MMHPYELTAAAAARAIRGSTLSPVELLESLIERIDGLDGRVRAFCHLDREGARHEAAELEREAAAGEFRGALHGVPFAAKDMFRTAGMPTEAGSAVLRGSIPRVDATSVARLKAAGAILLGKTHTTEFANVDPAPTANPWNLAHTPGGSSSGSAAAVAARMIPISLATQTGGSTLRPAAYCGVLGLKPSYGRVSVRGVIPLTWCMDHVGIIARCVADLGLVLQALAGQEPRDRSGAAAPLADYASAAIHGRPPRIGVVRDYFFENAEADAAQVTDRAIRRLASAGASIRDVKLPPAFGVIHAAQRVAEYAEIAEVHAQLYADRGSLYGPSMRETIEVGSVVPGTAYIRAHRIRGRFRDEMSRLLRSFDVLAMPTARGAAPRGGSVGDWDFQSPWSSAGLPSVSLPCGRSTDGLPLGLQLVSAPLADDVLLTATAWSEAVLGQPALPPIATACGNLNRA
jgi:aspartyl-tRNA(Asn)/glutamyl-tRNA(Gln) amidotransferase subunit A